MISVTPHAARRALTFARHPPYTTQPKLLFWAQDLPPDAMPDDWTWSYDLRVPTVRSNERPYHRGENYSCIIDGFLTSPNVEVIAVEARDLDFRDSDHNPVILRFRCRR